VLRFRCTLRCNVISVNNIFLFCNIISCHLFRHFHALQFRAMQIGPSIPCPAILTVRHFHVRHFQSTIRIRVDRYSRRTRWPNCQEAGRLGCYSPDSRSFESLALWTTDWRLHRRWVGCHGNALAATLTAWTTQTIASGELATLLATAKQQLQFEILNDKIAIKYVSNCTNYCEFLT